MIYNASDKLECYSSSGKSVCTISADGINFVGLDWGDYDYTLDETYYPNEFNEVSLEFNGSMSNGKTIRNWINSLKNKEEKEMNKVLELYYERKLDKLKEFYSDLEKQEYNKLEVVKEFNAINEEYANKMEELRNKHNTIDKQFVVKTGYKDDNRYELLLDTADMIGNPYKFNAFTE